MDEEMVVVKKSKHLSYACITFYSFAVAFFVLSVVNCFLPISNFKMTVLSFVAVLFSLQQLYEAKEEVNNKISESEMKVTHQEELLQLIGYSNIKPKKRVDNTSDVTKSRWIFAVTMIILIVGLTLDFDFQNSIVANTLTIISFAVIFFTMGYKERYSERIDRLNEELFAIDQRIITKLKEQVDELQKL